MSSPLSGLSDPAEFLETLRSLDLGRAAGKAAFESCDGSVLEEVQRRNMQVLEDVQAELGALTQAQFEVRIAAFQSAMRASAPGAAAMRAALSAAAHLGAEARRAESEARARLQARIMAAAKEIGAGKTNG